MLSAEPPSPGWVEGVDAPSSTPSAREGSGGWADRLRPPWRSAEDLAQRNHDCFWLRPRALFRERRVSDVPRHVRMIS